MDSWATKRRFSGPTRSIIIGDVEEYRELLTSRALVDVAVNHSTYIGTYRSFCYLPPSHPKLFPAYISEGRVENRGLVMK